MVSKSFDSLRVDRSVLGGSSAYAHRTPVSIHDRGNGGCVSSELASEAFNRINREIEQILERWDDRLVFPPTKLAERYLRGHLDLHLHVSRRTDSSYNPWPEFPRHLDSNSISLCSSRNVEAHDVDSQDEFPVLINSVQIVDEPERVPTRIGSVVRLQSLDSCQRTGTGNALYFSAVTANFSFCNTARLRPFSKHGELNLGAGLCLHIGRGQLPCEVIEGGSEVVDDFTSKHTESRFDLVALDEVYEFVVSLPVFIGDDWLSCGYIHIQSDGRDGSQEIGNPTVQLLDVLVGPF